MARRSSSAWPGEKPASASATASTWSWKTITPSVSASASASSGWSYGIGNVGVGAAGQPPLDVGVHGAALDRAGPHQRHLDHQVVEVLRLRAQQHLHLGARLDLEHADRVGGLDLGVDARRRRAGCATGRRAAPCSASETTHSSTADSMPRPSRSIFRKPASPQESLSHWQIVRPSIAAGCSGTIGRQRPVGDDHAARVLGEVARQPGDLARQRRQRPEAAVAGALGDAGQLGAAPR